MVRVTKALISRLVANPASEAAKLSDDDLAAVLAKANHSYYNEDIPLFTDDLFDLLKDALTARAPSHAFLRAVGAEIAVDDKRKETLPYHMGSLDKIKTDEKIISKFKSKHPGEYLISDKLDGNSGLYYLKNKEAKLFTRGDGKVGQNVSNLLGHLSGIPANIASKHKDELAVRGEVILSRKAFEKVKHKGANARNMVAGMLNAKKPDPEIAKLAEFVAYEVIEPKLEPKDQMELLEKLGFRVVQYQLFNEAKLSSDNLSEFLVDRRERGAYEIDGIVVMHNKVHRRQTDGNPTYAFAFKSVHTMAKAEVIVTGVEWNLSKDGYLVPTVNFNGVSLGGVNIKKATGFNGKFIQDNKIGPGSRILIMRAGDVIPHIVEALSASATGKGQMPEHSFLWSKSGVDIMLTEDNKRDNEELRLKNLENFVKKIDVPGLGPGNVKKMFEAGFDTPRKMFEASVSDLLKVDGFKDKTAQKIRDALQERRYNLTCLQVMDASNAMGRGLAGKKLEMILDAFPQVLENRYVPTIDELVKVKGVEKTTATLFAKNLPAFFAFVDDNKIKCTVETAKRAAMAAAEPSADAVPEPAGVSFAGEKVVFTGFRNKDLEAYLVARGADVSGSVSKKTTLVLCKDIDDDSGKMEKAREFGVKIVQVDEFIKNNKIKV